MPLIKKLKIGNSEIEIYSDVSEEEKKENIKGVYNTIHKIARNKMEQGIDVSDWFYTKEQISQMEKSGEYNFL